jgi:hypothetical protein
MFNVECIVKPSILNVALPMDAMRRTLVLIKFEDVFLIYNHNNP